MAHTLDELRKYRNGRGTSSASSSDSQRRHTLEELRSLDTRRRPQTTQSTQTATTPSEPIKSDRPEGVSSSWMSHTGNATLDSINNMLSMRKVMQAANATPKNMPTLQTNEEVKDYYESLGNHNAIERLFNKEKAEEYNQKQALYPQYHEIKKEEDMKKLAEYGITDDDMRKYASYLDESSRNNFFRGDTRRQVETRRTDQEIQNIKKATGVDLYDYLDEYKGELAKEDANAHPVLSTLNTYAQNPGESLTNVATDVGAYATGKPIKDNYSYTDTVRNEITENIDSGVGKFAYGTANSIADMGVAMALGTVTGGGTLVSAGTMGLEKASNVMNDAVERGLTPNQIMLEGIASGVTTAATEAIPMGKWEEVAKKGFVGLHGKALAKEITKKFLANALPEGLQEMEEDIADAIMDELIAGDKSEINVTISKLMENGYSREQAEAMAWRDWTKQMVLDGLGGFISGGVMSGGSVAVGLANPYARGEVNREALTEQIKGMDTEGETYKAYRELSEKRGENLENATENEVSDLFLKAYEEASTFDRTEVNEIFKEELKKHDYSEEQANETLEAVLAENKTNYQKSLINNSLVKDALKTAYKSDEGVAMRLRTSMNQTALEDTIKTSDQVKVEKKIAKAESKINTAEESSVNGEKVDILGMDIKGGVYVINTDKGTFNADDVNVASSIKDAVAYSVNIKDPAFKEAFVTNYRGQDIDTYEAYAYEAFTAGKNFNASILEQGNFIDFLGANALEDFLDAGRMSVSRSTKESEERSIKAAAEAEGKFQKGTFTSEVDYNTLKSTQKKVYNFLKGMSNIGGLNINVIYNTETVENGFFQYDSESGGTITVNLAAKARVDEKGIGSTYVIPVLSHELTHYLEKNAESSYMILQKAVFNVLRADGMNIDDEVRSKIEKYKAHNVELTEAEAVHEIIAQACEGMMSNENTMKKALSYMNEREMKTFKKALDKFFSAVKQFVKSLAGGDEIQNRYADAISRNIDEVQDAWAKAFADALKRQQTLNKEVSLKEDMIAEKQYSLQEDSEGKKLTEDQIEFFKDTQIVDEKGRLKVMYHGTPFGTFTEFKKKTGVVNREHYGHWFSDSKKLAERFKNFEGIMSWKELINEKVYTGYIKSTNPYILDAHGLAWNNLPLPTEIARWMWDKLSPSDKSLFQKMFPEKGTWERFDHAATDDIAEFAQKNGYDAVVIKNVKEYSADSGTVVKNSVCIFNSNQFKDINNEHPTKDPDIRYSIQEDSEGNKLTEGQQNYFKNSKVVDENGNLIVLYHGTISPGFTKFNTENLIYLTSDRFVAKSFSNASVSTDYFNPNTGEGSIYKLYANIENPLIVDATKTVLSGKYDAKISYDRDTGRYTVELTNKDRKHDYTTYNIGEIFDEKTVSQINDHFDKNVKSPYSIKNKNVLIQSPSYYYDVEFNGEKVGTDDIADYAKKNGYDGVIVNNVIEGGEYSGAATDVIVFDANQIKSVNNENPTKDPDIRYSLQEDSEGNKLTKEQQEYFAESKVRDNDGNLLRVRHGTDSAFTIFNPRELGGQHGSAEGYGIYFSDDKEVTSRYGSNQLEGYLNIVKPAYSDKKTINETQLVRFIRATVNYEVNRWETSPEDTWISNFVDTSRVPLNDAFFKVADDILKNESNDKDIIQQIMISMGIRNYKLAYEFYDVLTDTLGFDGFIVKWKHSDGESNVFVAFDSNQFKLADNLNPTEDSDIRYSLQDESEIPDDEKATYQTLEDDVKLLRDFTKLAKEDMKWQAKDMNAFSEYLIMKYDSTISEKDLKEELANLFNAIPEQTDNWLNVMDACFGLASEIYEVSNKKVSVDKNVDADARQAVQAAKRRNAIQHIAIDIYNKYWTMTSYYTDNERAKGLKAQHRQNIKNAVEKQKRADTIYYKNLIEKTKRRAEEDRARIKTKTEDRIKAMRESNERKAEIQKIEDQAAMFDKWIKQNSKNHPVPDILREPLEMLLATIDPVTREKGKANKKQESLSLSIQKVASALSNINNEMAKTDKPNGENTESGLEMLDIPPYMVAELNEIATKMHELEVNYEVPGSKPLQLMKLADLKKLKQDMNAIQKAISTANNLITRANKERVNYVGQKIISYLSKLPQAKRDALNETLTKGVDFLTLDNTTPFYFFKHLGECGSILFDILADGMDDMTNKVEEISDFTEATYTEEDQKKWRNNIREFELLQKLTDAERASGKENKVKVKLTDAQIMSLYCLSKREVEGRHQALEHILRDGIAIGKIDAKKKIARQDTVTITESQLNDIISIVENDKKMKAVADALQHFMSSVCSDWGNRVTMSRWGIKQFTEKFYFPIAVNAELKKTDAADSVGSLFALLNQDFTKPLQDNVRNEIMVYDIFDVFTKHTSDMARYSALGLPILDLIKVWNYSEAEKKTSGNKDEDEEYKQRKVSSVKKSIAKAFGERGGNKYISTLIKNLNGKADRGVYDNIGMSLMRKYKASKVAASTMTALVQPLSIFRAAYVMNNKYLLRGLAHRPQIEKCFKNVGVAKWKRMSIGVDTNIGRGVDRIINHQTTFGDKVMDKSLWLAEKMDELTWGYIYNAVEEEVKDTRKNLNPDTEEFDEAVSKRAREVFYATQIFDSTLTRSAFMRDKGYHAVILSAFMSEPTLSYNMLLDSVTEYYQDAKINGSSHAFNTKGKVVASAISIYVLSAAVESVIREAFTRIRDYDEDDEEFFDGFVMAVVDRLLDELNILNKLPYTKQLMDGLSAFKSGYRNNNKMDEAFISDIANSYKAIKKAVEREEVTYKTVYTTLNALSDVTGLPFANALREVKAVWNNTIGRITGNYFK